MTSFNSKTNLKIGIIGLGDIAQKAYLPIITTMGLDLVFCTRNSKTLDNLKAQYRVNDSCTDYHELLSYPIDAVFIHSSTESHYEIAHYFLSHGVHVYVDKPVSTNYDDILNLSALAKDSNLTLMCGFNRRHVPRINEFRQDGLPDTLMIQKNRFNHPGDIRTFIYDDFIHVIDTLLYLYNQPIDSINYNAKVTNGQIEHITLSIHNSNTTAIGLMNRMSGLKEERIEFTKKNKKNILLNLDQVEVFENEQYKVVTYDDWVSTLERRGFKDIISTFITAIQTGDTLEKQLIDSIETHRICNYLVSELEASSNS